MFPLFALVFVADAALCLATALRSFQLWRRIRSPENARPFGWFGLTFLALGSYFAAWGAPLLVSASDPFIVAAGYAVAHLFYFLALAAASYTVIGFGRYAYVGATLFLASGFWLTYWRLFDFGPAQPWHGYGVYHAEPLVWPIFKLAIAFATALFLVPATLRARRLEEIALVPFTAPQFRHFAIGAGAFMASVGVYYGFQPFGLVTTAAALFVSAPLGLMGCLVFYQALRREPYVPQQIYHVTGRRALP